jgi:outer membrane protein TolC
VIETKLIPVIGCFCAAIFVFGQAQTNPAPQKPLPPPSGTTTTGTLPPPPSTTGNLPVPTNQNLTPPVMPKTTPVQTPPDLSIPGPPVPTPGVPNTPLTAQEAAALALAKQPNVAIALAQLEAARGQVAQTKSGLYPQLNLSQAYSRTDTFYGNTNNSNPVVSTTGGTTGSTTGTTAGTTGTTSGTTGTTSGTTGTTSGTTGTTSTTTSGTTGTAASTLIVGKSQGWSGEVTLSQLLFDFNHTRDLVSEYEAAERAAKHGYTKAEIDTILTVKQAFYTYVQNDGLAKVQLANVNSAQASLTLAQALVAGGLGAPADVVSATTTLDTAEQALVQARATALTSRLTLCFDIGIDPRTPFVPANSAEPAESGDDLNTLVNLAVMRRPDVLQAVETLRSEGYAVSAARTSNAPTFNFQLGVTNFGQTNPLATDSLVPTVSVTWTFEDAGLTAGKVESAKAEQEIAKQTLQLTTQGAIQDVSTSFVNVQAAEQRLTVANAEVANGVQNLKLAQGQYQAGVTPFVTVITAQAQQVQAEVDQVNAIANLAQTRATLSHSLGNGI